MKRVFGIDFAVRASQMGHEDDSLGSVIDSIFDGWDSSGNTLIVGNVLVRVERDVEIDLLQ